MSGLTSYTTAPSRSDAMYPGQPENSIENARDPVQSDIPPSAEMPQ
jgi:hypothetical protein